jgi:myo-inositol-1(or 4)-monophosphatase
MEAGGMFYRNGSGALMLALVAAGRLGGYYEPHMNPWDCLAGLLMIDEAGGHTLPVTADPAGGLVLGAAPNVFASLHAVINAATLSR